jgi:beta-phosphoglucomutase
MLVDSPHERAWRDPLRLLMETVRCDAQPRTSHTPGRFTAAVYQVAGKPRLSGARAGADLVIATFDALAGGPPERRSR